MQYKYLYEYYILAYIVGRISAQFCNNWAVSEESTILQTVSYADFDTSMNIRYGGICEINADS